jgi:hypothetical protein
MVISCPLCRCESADFTTANSDPFICCICFDEKCTRKVKLSCSHPSDNMCESCVKKIVEKKQSSDINNIIPVAMISRTYINSNRVSSRSSSRRSNDLLMQMIFTTTNPGNFMNTIMEMQNTAAITGRRVTQNDINAAYISHTFFN